MIAWSGVLWQSSKKPENWTTRWWLLPVTTACPSPERKPPFTISGPECRWLSAGPTESVHPAESATASSTSATWRRRFSKLPDELKRLAYFIAALLIQVGIFSIRWNVVIGGQLFSKSLRGLTVYKLELAGEEGLLVGLGFLLLPFLILWVLVKILPPWGEARTEEPAA